MVSCISPPRLPSKNPSRLSGTLKQSLRPQQNTGTLLLRSHWSAHMVEYISLTSNRWNSQFATFLAEFNKYIGSRVATCTNVEMLAALDSSELLLPYPHGILVLAHVCSYFRNRLCLFKFGQCLFNLSLRTKNS